MPPAAIAGDWTENSQYVIRTMERIEKKVDDMSKDIEKLTMAVAKIEERRKDERSATRKLAAIAGAIAAAIATALGNLIPHLLK